MSAPRVGLHDVSFKYPTSETTPGSGLFENFSLDIGSHGIVAVMGASGSGKSTLGKLLAGLLAPQSGHVSLPAPFTTHAARVYVDQNPLNSVFPWQSVHRNVSYPLDKLRWSRGAREERTEALLEIFGLSRLRAVFPANLSGGELQRLALARAISWRPRLMVLDETLGNLDHRTRREIITSLRELVSIDDMMIVAITHNFSDVLALGARCVVLGARPVQILMDERLDESAPDRLQSVVSEALRYGLV